MVWNGELNPAVKLGRNNSEMRELEKLMLKNLDRLDILLSEKAADILERYNECVSEYLSVTSRQAFCDGFCLGTRINAEAMQNTEQLL